MIRKILIDYKFNDKSYFYKTIVNFLLKNKNFFSILKSYDTIIPVPISPKRKKQRGYNQSELIAREIAKRTELYWQKKCLYKTKNIVEQSTLKKEQRQENVQGVYQIYNSKNLEKKKIILVDDIYTTGSTVKECCKMLSQAKIKKIGVLTIAKD